MTVWRSATYNRAKESTHRVKGTRKLAEQTFIALAQVERELTFTKREDIEWFIGKYKNWLRVTSLQIRTKDFYPVNVPCLASETGEVEDASECVRQLRSIDLATATYMEKRYTEELLPYLDAEV